MVEYFRFLQRKDIQHLSPSPELMINVHGLALNLGADGLWMAGVHCRWPCLGRVLKAPLWRWVLAASAGSLLVPPHVYGYYTGLLLLGLWLAVFRSGEVSTKLAATALLTPIPFLLNLAPSPWSAATPLVLLMLLATMTWKMEPLYAPAPKPW